jgi:hypothetical protein
MGQTNSAPAPTGITGHKFKKWHDHARPESDSGDPSLTIKGGLSEIQWIALRETNSFRDWKSGLL